MAEGSEKGVGRVAQGALQHAARLCAAVALPFEAADDVECLLHIAYDRADIDLRRLARQPDAAFIAANRLKIPLAAERLTSFMPCPRKMSKRATISLIVASASPSPPANISTLNA
jgi:hypothetical protein